MFRFNEFPSNGEKNWIVLINSLTLATQTTRPSWIIQYTRWRSSSRNAVNVLYFRTVLGVFKQRRKHSASRTTCVVHFWSKFSKHKPFGHNSLVESVWKSRVVFAVRISQVCGSRKIFSTRQRHFFPREVHRESIFRLGTRFRHEYRVRSHLIFFFFLLEGTESI